MKFILLTIIIFGFGFSAFSQIRHNNFCYQEDNFGDNDVFEIMEIYPSFNGGLDKLNQFLLQNINVEKITSSINKNTRFISDTLQLRFIISKDKKMSRLLVTGTQNNIIKDELQRVFILTSCNWMPGVSSGRNLTGWFKEQLIFTMDRRGRYLSLKIEWLGSTNGTTTTTSSFEKTGH